VQKAALLIESVMMLVRAVGHGRMAAVSANDQGLVDQLASEAETVLDAAGTDTGRLSGLPAS
jgi:hypothetical protein